MKLQPGIALATLNGQHYTNATIVKIEGENITVLSDFGNLMTFAGEKSLFSVYALSANQMQYLAMRGEIEPVKERIAEQIEKLQAALAQL